MSNAVMCPPDDSLWPLSEEQSHPKHAETPQEIRPSDTQQSAIFTSNALSLGPVSSTVTDPPDDSVPPLLEEQSHPEHSKHVEETRLSEINPPDGSLPPLLEEQNNREHPEDPEEVHHSEMQQVVITSMRATDLALGLRRIPAGFYVTVQVDGAEWQTTSKPVNIDQDVVEWKEQMLLPLEPSSKVRFRVYASFELGLMLGHGELLRTCEISVGELLNRSEDSRPFVFQPKAGEVISSCTSLFITVEQRISPEDATVLRLIHPLASSEMDTLILRTDAGHRLLARYRRTQNYKDLGQSIEHFEHACQLCPDNHPCRSAVLSNIATARLINCQGNGTYDLDLDVPISLLQDALELRPTGHPDRPVTQLHLAIALVSRFAKRSFQADADAAEELLNEVLDVCLPNSHVYRAALLAVEISALHPASSTDVNDVGRERPTASMLPCSPDELARRMQLCQQTDDPRVLDEVISLHYDALRYYSTTHAQHGQLVCNLGAALITRFVRQGNHHDLDDAITLLREALALQPVGHPERSVSLNNLATSLSVRIQHRGNEQDLEEAIVLNREALGLRPVGHSGRSMSLTNLASVLSTRFKYGGNDQDLDEAIGSHTEALCLRPVGHPDRAMSLNNLAVALSIRLEHRSNVKDLDIIIAHHREALTLRLVGHPDRSSSLNNLASAISARFEHQIDAQYPDEAIALHREALSLHPIGHPDRSASLHNLANALSTRFKHKGNEQDLDEAIVLDREGLAFHPVDHPDRSGSLNNLANVLFTCFQHRGDERYLNEATAFHRDALGLRQVGHPDRAASTTSLANVLYARFKHRGNDKDLDVAIALHREALASRPVGHPDRPESLNALAMALCTNFKRRGNGEDLDEAIALHREALALRPVGHPGRSESMDNLATPLFIHFERRGNDKDLDEVIVLYREALPLLPVSHPDQRTSLNNLANALSVHFQHGGNVQDLEEAIALHNEVLALLPVGGPDRPTSLNNLALTLSTRFKHRGNDQDIDEAVRLHREVLDLRPVDHLDRSVLLTNLATALSTRFKHRGNGEDLDESLENARNALTQLTQHDPFHSTVHQSLATIHLLFYQSGLHGTGEDTDSLNAAMHHLKAGADFVSASLLPRLQASLSWVLHADKYTHITALEAYATSMNLLDAFLSVTASVSSRHHIMKLFPPTLAVDAASCALRRGDVCHAVELLEQGRTIIWTQMARLRTPLQILEGHNDHTEALVKKFRHLTSLLNKPPVQFPEMTSRIEVEADATLYTRLVDGWNRVVGDIRKVDGFSHFLLPPLFSDIKDAARDGPIVILIASNSSCDAIIVPHKQPPLSVRLATDLEKLGLLVNGLRQTVQKDSRADETQPKLIEALRKLWVDIVHPVVENLGKFAKPGSRIWWCPTSLFNFLPLHAAGEYRRGGMNLSQLYASSYTPSLTALIRARKSHDRSPHVPFAAIGQNRPEGASFTLEYVEPELDLVRSLLPPPPTVSFTKVTSMQSTKSRALSALRDNTWLHFACHGKQDFAEPFKSAFFMRDKPLSLLDITQTDLSRHEFAFLSACETAVGDMGTPDEVIHLAAALQFAGVKSVIGTSWEVDDATVRRLVEAFYKNFCGDGKMNSKRAARALHGAVQSLACDKDVPLDQRIVFMHIANANALPGAKEFDFMLHFLYPGDMYT
ncbi:CHAT domain-containing protein [Suillus ampliporus]|nr:CHAT domain-containing protein [Suillus ampliporus]